MGIYGELDRARLNEADSSKWAGILVSHTTEEGKKACTNFDPAETTHNEAWVLQRLAPVWEQEVQGAPMSRSEREARMLPMRASQGPVWRNEGRRDPQHQRGTLHRTQQSRGEIEGHVLIADSQDTSPEIVGDPHHHIHGPQDRQDHQPHQLSQLLELHTLKCAAIPPP